MAMLTVVLTTTHAQVKIGNNPTVLGTNNTLEVEATNAKKVAVKSDTGQLIVGSTATTVPTGGTNAAVIIDNGTTAGAVQIKDGTEGFDKVLVSDLNGLATWQSRSGSWLGILSSGTTANVPGGQSQANFINSLVIGSGGTANTTTDAITVPKNGFYRITISAFSNGTTSPYLTYWEVISNGGVLWVPHYSGASASWGTSVSCSYVSNLNAGDVITLYRNNSFAGFEGISNDITFIVELIQ